MFIFTAKFNRKRAIAIIIALAIILCAIILVAGYIDRGKNKARCKSRYRDRHQNQRRQSKLFKILWLGSQ